MRDAVKWWFSWFFCVRRLLRQRTLCVTRLRCWFASASACFQWQQRLVGEVVADNSSQSFLCPLHVNAKNAICNSVVMSVLLSVCLSVIGIRGQRAYRLRRLAAVPSICRDAATPHKPLIDCATRTQTFPATGIQFSLITAAQTLSVGGMAKKNFRNAATLILRHFCLRLMCTSSFVLVTLRCHVVA